MGQGFNFNFTPPQSSGGILEGIKTGSLIRQRQEQMAASEQKRERMAQMQASLTALAQNDQATAEDYSRMMLEYPEISQDVKRSFDLLSGEQQQSKLSQGSDIYSALETGNKEVALDLVEKQKQAALSAGLDDEAKKMDILSKQIEMNPEAAKTALRLSLSTIMGPDKFASTFKTLKEAAKKFKILSKEDKEEIGLDTDKPFQRGSDGRIYGVGGGGVNVNVQRDAPPAGYRYIFNKNGQVESMEVIPGSKAERDLQKDIKKDVLKGEKKLREGELFIASSEKLIGLIKGAPWYSPVAGKMGQIFPGIRQNTIDAKALEQTLRARLGFAELQAMRESSPTGGALGPVSNTENALLQDALVNLKLAQSEKQLIENLTIVNKLTSKIIHGDSYDYLRMKDVVKKIEANTGSPLTEEELDYMLDKGFI